ncbi:MAG TPA: T9SS type A sorting domain-containing protein, partial [Bacteroidia bacterium]|nr:T9SS type A sorting domain-containing protein [Bacteroidia bacterium]
IDSVTTLQGLRKRYILMDSSGNFYYNTIEGVGSFDDPFLNYAAFGDPVYALVCSYQNHTPVYDANLYGYNCYSYDSLPCNAIFTYSAGVNGQLTFTNTYPGYSSHWQFLGMVPDTTVINNPSLTITFTCNTTFSVICTVHPSIYSSDSCTYFGGAIVNNVPASSTPHPSFTYTVEGNGQIDFTNTSSISGSNTQWYWSIVDANSNHWTSSTTSPSFSLPVNENYTVTLYMYTGWCSATDTTQVIYNNEITTGVQKLINNDKEVIVYPNPAQDKIYIKGKEIMEIMLFDVLVNEILTTKETEIDVTTLPNGIYFLQVKTNKEVLSKKLIVRH